MCSPISGQPICGAYMPVTAASAVGVILPRNGSAGWFSTTAVAPTVTCPDGDEAAAELETAAATSTVAAIATSIATPAPKNLRTMRQPPAMIFGAGSRRHIGPAAGTDRRPV